MEKLQKERDASIDILRFIAIVGIIIAHSAPNLFFTQIRGFDVVLMVFLSAVCTKGFEKKNFNYSFYLYKRCIRLILPVWIFLVFYYVGIYLFYYLPSPSDILSSFIFTSDLYVWIIRILVILAMLAPVIWKYTNKFSPHMIMIILFIGFALSEYLFNLCSSKLFDMIFMTVPYCMVYILGMTINRFNRKQKLILAGCFFTSSIILAIYYGNKSGEFVPTSDYKYPPQFYYMSYALAVALFMWTYRKQIESFMHKINLLYFTKYVGRHTYWLYLWHIPIIDIVGNKFNSFVRFSIIFMGALICVTIQNVIVKRFIKNKTLISVLNG